MSAPTICDAILQKLKETDYIVVDATFCSKKAGPRGCESAYFSGKIRCSLVQMRYHDYGEFYPFLENIGREYLQEYGWSWRL